MEPLGCEGIYAYIRVYIYILPTTYSIVRLIVACLIGWVADQCSFERV